MTSTKRVSAALVSAALLLSACTATSGEPQGDFSYNHFRGVVTGSDLEALHLAFGETLTGGGSCGSHSWMIEGGEGGTYFVVAHTQHLYTNGSIDTSSGEIDGFSLQAVLTEEMQVAIAYEDPDFILDQAYWAGTPTNEAGIRLGSTEQYVRAAYPNATDVTTEHGDNLYNDEVYLLVTDGHGGFQEFHIEGDMVFQIDVGLLSARDAEPESC